MPGPVDLHTHTTASDGTLGPRQLVQLAARHGVRVLAITDHDSTEALAEAGAEAERLGVTLVPGIEINCEAEGAEVHVLGYFVDAEAGWFQEFLREQRAERRARIFRMAARLTELGLPVDPAEVLALAGDGAAGRPHVAQVMVRRGYVATVREAFERFLRAGGPAWVPRHRLSPADAVAVIRRAGGVAVLAHPGLADRDALIPPLVAAGLEGLEVYYPEHSPSQTEHYLDLCRRLALLATGGSDFHGPASGSHTTPGMPEVPWEAWEALRRRARRAGAPP
jgi:predicted metal-dependent phosphoesterase TrpH